MNQLAGCSVHPEPYFRATRVQPELPQYSQLVSHRAPPRAPPPGRPDVGEMTGLDGERAETLADPAALLTSKTSRPLPGDTCLALPHSASPDVSFLLRDLQGKAAAKSSFRPAAHFNHKMASRKDLCNAILQMEYFDSMMFLIGITFRYQKYPFLDQELQRKQKCSEDKIQYFSTKCWKVSFQRVNFCMTEQSAPSI